MNLANRNMKYRIWIVLVLFILIMNGCQEVKKEDQIADTVQSSTQSIVPVLEGQPNFRDLGGYETIDGLKVRKGVIYRTGELNHITSEDLEKLDSMKLITVINFLTPEEIDLKGEDILPDFTQTVSIPLNSGNLAMEIQQSVRSGDFENVPPDQNAQLHAILTQELENEYGQFIKELTRAEQPVAYHCSHGVHRTGTATAIFLGILGVPWETIQKEYLLTNDYQREEVEAELEKTRKMVAEKKGIDPSEVDMTNINAFYILEGSYIDATRDYIINNYGTFEEYAINGLGLTEEDILLLKDIYLE